MAAYNGTKSRGLGIPTKEHHHVNRVVGSFAVSVALALNDTIELCGMPSGAILTDFHIAVPDLDTGGSPAITLSLGDLESAARYVSASTVGQAGGVISRSATPQIAASVGFQTTVETALILTVAAGPQTGATGVTINYIIEYTMNP